MNKNTVSLPPLTNPSTLELDSSVPSADLEHRSRLIVLIPEDSDCTTATRRIWRLANETNTDVQLLGLVKDISQELTLRRDLATLSGLIRDANVFVETKVEVGNNWLNVVKRNYQEGDMIVCLAEKTVGIRQRPLSQVLESNFKAPVYILSDIRPVQSRSNIFSQVIAWSGFIGIIAGFFLLEMRIVKLPDDWFRTLISVILLIPELGLILLWNSLF